MSYLSTTKRVDPNEPDRIFHNEGLTWAEFFDDGGHTCTLCGQVVDDRRYAVGLAIRRAWSPITTEYRFCHVECLRKTMHHQHPLG